MNIEIIVFLGFVFTVTSTIAKAYERHQDVLYGPYIQGRDPRMSFEDVTGFIARALEVSGLRKNVESLSWKARNLSCFASAIIC